MRRLPRVTPAASPARSIPSCLPTTARLQLQPQLRPSNTPSSIPTIYQRQQIPHRTLTTSPSLLSSSSPSSHSSPFRLTTHPSTEIESQSLNPTLHPESSGPAEGEYYSPYKPKRQWPPDMSKLSPKHQFRLERKYRRRAALKYARPKWTKATKLVQWGGIGFVIVYAMLFMEWDERGSPFDELRKYVFRSFKGAFSAPPPPGSMRRSDDSSA